MEPDRRQAPQNAPMTDASLRRGGVTARKALALAGLAVALVGALIGTAWLLNRPTAPSSHASFAQGQPVPTVTASPTATITPTPGGMPSGWQAAPNLTRITNIVTTPSQPATAYGCGAANGKAWFTASHDGGTTWAATRAIEPGYGCILSVSPQDALQIAAMILPCQASACGSAVTEGLWRSNDGGATWQAAMLPGAATNTGFDGIMGWTASSLFVSVELSGAPHLLAVSVNGAALAWADQNGMPFSQDGGSITSLYGIGDTIYAGAHISGGGAPCGTPPAVRLYVSTDHGATWTSAATAFHDGGQTVAVVDTAMQTLIGVIGDNNTSVVSIDGGNTWRPVPTMGGLLPCFTYATPSGAIIADLEPVIQPGAATLSQGFYELAPQANAWTPILTAAPGAGVIGLTSDASGAPARIWGVLQDPATNTTQVIYRTLAP